MAITRNFMREWEGKKGEKGENMLSEGNFIKLI